MFGEFIDSFGMIPLAFSTNAFKKNTLSEAVEAIAAIGYAGVEIMADVPHAHPASFTPALRDLLHKQLESWRLKVSNVNGFTHFADGDTYHPTWVEDDPARRQLRISHTLGCVDLAAEFGVKTLSLQPGGPTIGTTITPKLAGERFSEGLRQVLPLARQKNVVLAIEPEPGLFIETAAEYLAFRNEFFADEPLVKMNCDVGHLFCVGEDPASIIRQMPDQIAHVHLEDIGANRVHQHLTPGKGVINFQSIFSALADIGYTGWVTVELYPYETTAAGVAKLAWEHLQKVVAKKTGWGIIVDSTMTVASPPHQWTAEDLLRLPDNNGMELVDGQIVEKPVSLVSSTTVMQIGGIFWSYLNKNPIARLFSSEMGYKCFQMLPDDPERMRKPDVSLIKMDRIRKLSNPNPGYLPIFADLAVEVLSTHDTFGDVSEKLREYRLAGFPLVWIVDPIARTVMVHPNPGKPFILSEDDDISAPDVLPGFSCKLADLFPQD